MRWVWLIAVALASPALGEVKLSRATDYLMTREAAKGCPAGGRFDHGFFELDLTGDGIRDLVLSHEGVICEGERARSLLCGMQACTVLFFVGLENGLLVQVDQAFGREVNVDGAEPPITTLTGRSGGLLHLQWNGTAFREIER